jgi:iron complex transport system ATP-binding protein
MLDATGLTVRLGRRTILSRLDFRATAGDFTVIVGPN